ncbi:MAG TPA: NAD(P)H-binding protein [Capillimicrobium sp.]
MTNTEQLPQRPVAVLGATGKTGRRIVDRLRARDVPVRLGSRSAEPAFDWQDRATWRPLVRGARAVYAAYSPDLALPGAAEAVEHLAELAVEEGVERLVLLSGRGEEEAQRAERLVQAVPIDSTIVRCSWFMQNFSEGLMAEGVAAGVLALPVGDVPEPFVDCDDIADVAVAALTEDGHAGELYELTGPRALSFADAVATIAAATGRPARFETAGADAFAAELRAAGLSAGDVDGILYLFTEILDGRNTQTADGVQRALGRPPRGIEDYARDAAAAGAWDAARATAPAG